MANASLATAAARYRSADTRYGPLQLPVETRDLIGRFLTCYGEWAQLEIEFIAGVVEDGASVADIGAYLGTFGLGLSGLKQLGRVCFVEANGAVVPLLQCNVDRNCAAEATVVEALIAPADYSASGWQIEGNIGATSFAGHAHEEGRIAVEAPTTRMTLDALSRQHGEFDLIKLDVEGLELPILRDARALLRRKRTKFWIECNETAASIELAEFLLKQGHEVYYFAFPAFNRDNFKSYPTSLLPFAYEAGLLACRREVTLPATLSERGCLLERIMSGEGLRNALWRTPRWVPREIAAERAEQALALAVHALQGERFSQFLDVSGQALPPDEEWAPVSELREQHHQLETALANAGAEFESLGEQLRAAVAETAHATERLRRADIKIDRTMEVLAARVEQIRRTDRELAQAEARARWLADENDDLREALNWTTQLADQQRLLLRADRDVLHDTQTRLGAELDEARSALAVLGTELDEARSALAVAVARATSAEGRANAIETSRSWRAMAPLRRMLGPLHSLFHRLQCMLPYRPG